MKLVYKRSTALAVVFSIVLLVTACPFSKDQVRTVISSVNRAIPLLQAAGVDTTDANEIIRLMNEFDANPTAATLSAVTLLFDRMVAKAQTIPEQGKRTVVIVILVAANIALSALAEKYTKIETENPTDPRVGAPAVRMTIRRFASRGNWRCRAAGTVGKYETGQYMPMEMCKKHPDNSVVETR